MSVSSIASEIMLEQTFGEPIIADRICDEEAMVLCGQL